MKRQWLVVMASLLSLIGLGGCTNSEEPNIEIVQDMMENPAIKAQEYEADSPQHRGMRMPPEHTIPMGKPQYKYKGDPVGSAQNENPLAQDFTPAVLTLGQKHFETQCLVCHGSQGHGDGPVSSKMNLKPPSLMSEKVRNFKDGQIFHIITEGQGLMGSYASHIPDFKDRWAVVNYIRFLQKHDTPNK